VTAQPIKIAILAMGGEGGGVLADWIVDLGERNGYQAQSTSVPGVAQRTGATIYYVELFSRARAQDDDGAPVLALMPLPGDVDVVLASELMEAGRAVQRGLVTTERTTLITSTHRVYSIAEKSAMGDGRVDAVDLLAHAKGAARRFVGFDMAQTAQDSGSVISAVLFGALAGTGVLPFGRAQFESTVERGDVGVRASLKAFATAFARTQDGPADTTTGPARAGPPAPQPSHPRVRALVERVQHEFAASLQALTLEGVRRLIDYQDPDYAALYLDRMRAVCALPCRDEDQLASAVARHLALWMSYEDTVRVADLKTRAARFQRVRDEVGAQHDQLLAINEYMHPRFQEICETLPVAWGRWLQRSGWPRRLITRFTSKGRVVTTSSLGGFVLLYLVAGLRRWRRASLRYAQENQRITHWLQQIQTSAAYSPALALEIALCQRLVKGYSDTHERGVRNYDTLMDVVRRGGATLAPATLRELREAALADEHGHKLHSLLNRELA
jgi:indolepyruvate ferredoxin oxidoreductase beta subunit